jgi:hypothetical protein
MSRLIKSRFSFPSLTLRSLSAAALAAGIGIAALPAIAAETGTTTAQPDRAKIEARLDAEAKEIDTNHDGVISADELRAHQEKRRGVMLDEMMKRADANHDGKLTVEEYKTALSDRFAHRRARPLAPNQPLPAPQAQ